jgi:hypothetical protein
MNGKVFIHRDQPWSQGLVMELLRFTGDEEGLDDQVDCFPRRSMLEAVGAAQAFRW